MHLEPDLCPPITVQSKTTPYPSIGLGDTSALSLLNDVSCQ